MGLNIVLVEPEIPQNTGNISRTCGAIEATLHLVRPLGFSTDDRYLKRAGLDYWHFVDIRYWDSIDEVIGYAKKEFPDSTQYFCSARAKINYTACKYRDGDFFFFGKESVGLPEEVIKSHMDTAIRIPMREGFRCLNLSNSVAVIAYEAMRQLGFPDLQ